MMFCVIFFMIFVSAIAEQTETNKLVTNDSCKLPPYPENGNYAVVNVSKAEPGQAFDTVTLNITCNTGYSMKGKENSIIICFNGSWTEQITDCSRSCRLLKDHTVKYTCLLKDKNDSRECTYQEPEGTVVHPECNLGYYTSTPLPQMKCIAGSWNYAPKCIKECGRLPPKRERLILNGPVEEPIPWNAAVYQKRSKTHICGGTLVSHNVVISAGHCFWGTLRGRLEDPADYLVALGKQYRSFNDSKDINSQIIEVVHIKVQPYFHGIATNLQDDIAVMVLANSVELNTFVSPVCLDFDAAFEKKQLSDGAKGIVAGWGIQPSGKIDELVTSIEVPLLPIEQCISEAPPDFRPFITGDKICIGSKNGPTGVCKGFGGSGLAFPYTVMGTVRYYLRGLISAAPYSENCTNNFNTITQISKHEVFIKDFIIPNTPL